MPRWLPVWLRRYRWHVLLLTTTVLVAAATATLLTGRWGPWTFSAGPETDAVGGTSASPYGVRASWVVAENQRPGSPGWRLSSDADSTAIAGFASATYAARGQNVTLYVSAPDAPFHVEAYRVGYYQGIGARLVWRSAELPGTAQPPCPLAAGVNKVSCDNWAPSLTFPVTADFVPGDYLLKLVGTGNRQSYVPLTVWNPGSHAAYVVKNDVFTWQAWNPYGGYDYYVGQGACPNGVYPLCSRARVVSFDRPYGDEQGTGDFLWLEAPLVRFLEEQGLDVTYATDLTLVEHPDFLTGHRALLSLGHDECWSLAERQTAVAAAAHGTNIAFFGASAMLRHVRTRDSPLGRNREVVDYRDSAADPLNGRGDPREVTGNTWGVPPASWPEADFVGEDYNGFLAPGVRADLTIVDPQAWIFDGTGLRAGSALPNTIGSDVDSAAPGLDHPAGTRILAHSALPANQAQPRTRAGAVWYSDMTYYTDPVSQAGFWDSGTNNWIPALEAGSGESPGTAAMVRLITGNLLRLFGQTPAGRSHPAMPNWQRIYSVS